MGHPQFWLTGVLSSGENLARGRRRSEIDCVCWVCDFSRLYLLVVGCGTEMREMRCLCVSQGTKKVFRRRASFGLEGGSGRRNRSGGREWWVWRPGSRAVLIGFHALPGVGGARAVVWEPTLRCQSVFDGHVPGSAVRCSFAVYPAAREDGFGWSGGRAGPATPITAVNDSCLYMTAKVCRSGRSARSATTCRSRFRAFPAPDHCQCLS